MKKTFFYLTRLSLAFVFLWAFFDKLFGLGFATTSEKAWINGGSPTYGFLTHGVKGPFADFFSSLAGLPVVDWLFMIGLICIGISLLTGVLIRWGGIFGAIMLVLMYLAAMPPENNPIIDDHIVYALILLFFAYYHHKPVQAQSPQQTS